jgi:hypothetical protein
VPNDIPSDKIQEELNYFGIKWSDRDDDEEDDTNDITSKSPEDIFAYSFDLLQKGRWEIKEGLKLLQGMKY